MLPLMLVTLASALASAAASHGGSYGGHGGHGVSHGYDDQYETIPYHFNYGVEDSYSGAHFNQHESDDGTGVRQGSYSVLLPDGRTQHVNYHTNNYDGYVAEVTYDGHAVHGGGYGHVGYSGHNSQSYGISGHHKREANPSYGHGGLGGHGGQGVSHSHGYDDQYETIPYHFNYGVEDSYSGAHFNQHESDDGTGVRQGSYSVLLPDGRTQHVNYHTNDYDGYVAEVTYDGHSVHGGEYGQGHGSSQGVSQGVVSHGYLG